MNEAPVERRRRPCAESWIVHRIRQVQRFGSAGLSAGVGRAGDCDWRGGLALLLLTSANANLTPLAGVLGSVTAAFRGAPRGCDSFLLSVALRSPLDRLPGKGTPYSGARRAEGGSRCSRAWRWPLPNSDSAVVRGMTQYLSWHANVAALRSPPRETRSSPSAPVLLRNERDEGACSATGREHGSLHDRGSFSQPSRRSSTSSGTPWAALSARCPRSFGTLTR